MIKKCVIRSLRSPLSILRAGLSLIVCLTALGARGQEVNTPYSMYGYGILGDRATSMQRQMGSVGYAMNSGRQINVMNPASYASIDSLTFLFDIGGDMTILWSEEQKKHTHSFGGGLDYVTMQFPICSFMGGSAGLIPYSSVGYAFGNSIEHGTMENQGSGGISQAYLGVSGKFKGFAIGANVSYNFGTIANDVFSTPTGQGRTKFEHVMSVRDWDIQIGAQYTLHPSRFDKVVLGATYSPRKTMHGKTWATLQEMTQDSYPDTVAFSKMRDKYFLPNRVGAGVSYTRERASRFLVEFDFTWEGWKDAPYSPLYNERNPQQVVFEGMTFNNRTRFALGAEFVPKVRGSYTERITYRLGAYYSNDYLRIQGNSVRDYGVTCGFGFPTPEGKTMINLGLEWKHRQSFPTALLTENYLNITLGVNFNEVWFFKRKLK